MLTNCSARKKQPSIDPENQHPNYPDSYYQENSQYDKSASKQREKDHDKKSIKKEVVLCENTQLENLNYINKKIHMNPLYNNECYLSPQKYFLNNDLFNEYPNQITTDPQNTADNINHKSRFDDEFDSNGEHIEFQDENCYGSH